MFVLLVRTFCIYWMKWESKPERTNYQKFALFNIFKNYFNHEKITFPSFGGNNDR